MTAAKVIEIHNHLDQTCLVHCRPVDGQPWQYRRITYHWTIDLYLTTQKHSFAYKAGFTRAHFATMASCIAYLTPDLSTEMFAEFLMQDLASDDLLAPAGLYRDIGVIIVPAP